MEVGSAKDLQRKRRFQYGTNALLFTIGVVGILALVYVLVDRAGWRIDLTANRDFSLSEQTEGILADLKVPVTIRAFFRPQGDIDHLYIRRKVDDILRAYAHRTTHIDYQMVNPDLAVEATLAYGIHTDGTIVFQSGEHRKDFYSSQLFNYPSLEDGSLPLFVGEGLFTNALLAITKGAAKTLCFLTGHRERTLDDRSSEGISELASALTRENYQVRPVSFVTDPDWSKLCDLLVVSGPRLGLHRREDQAVWDFVAHEGGLVVMADPHAEIGLLQSLGQWQLEFPEAVVFDPERHFLLGPHYPAPELRSHPITDKLQEGELTPIFYLARPLKVSKDEQAGPYRVTEVLATSPQAWGEKNLQGETMPKRDPGQDLEGPLTLGVAIVHEETEGEAPETEKKQTPAAVLFGDSNFVSNGLIEIPGNRDLFLNAIAWLAGSEAQLAIRPQKTDFRPLILTAGQSRWVGLLTQFVYPCLFLAAGFGYWWKRRRP